MRKILTFKTVSPLFELERDDKKCLTFRTYDYHDERFRTLAQWNADKEWYIQIVNPFNNESFVRRIYNYSYLAWFDQSGKRDPSFYPHDDWRVIEWYPSFGFEEEVKDALAYFVEMGKLKIVNINGEPRYVNTDWESNTKRAQ